MADESYVWSEPKRFECVWSTGTNTAALAAVFGSSTLLGEANGRYNNVDVYIAGDPTIFTAGLGTMVLTLWACVGPSRVRLASIDTYQVSTDGDANAKCALVLYARSRPADKYEVTVSCTGAGRQHTAFTVELVCWGSEGGLPTSGAALQSGGLLPLSSIGSVSPANVTAIQYLWDGVEFVPMRGTADGFVASTPAPSGTTSVTRIAQANVDTLLKAAQTRRIGIEIVNDGTDFLYVKANAGAAAANSYTAKLAPGDSWSSPASCVYTGEIRGIWASAGAGQAMVTEYTA